MAGDGGRWREMAGDAALLPRAVQLGVDAAQLAPGSRIPGKIGDVAGLQRGRQSHWKQAQWLSGSSGVWTAAQSQWLPPGELGVTGGVSTKAAVSTGGRGVSSDARCACSSASRARAASSSAPTWRAAREMAARWREMAGDDGRWREMTGDGGR